MRLSNEILIIQIKVEHKISNGEINRVMHRDPFVEIAGRTRYPILAQISQQVDVITNEMKRRSLE